MAGRRRLTLLSIVVLTLVVGSPADAEVALQNLNKTQSRGELLKLLPESKPSRASDPECEGGSSSWDDGATSCDTLSIKHFSFAGRDFALDLHFSVSERLRFVFLIGVELGKPIEYLRSQEKSLIAYLVRNFGGETCGFGSAESCNYGKSPGAVAKLIYGVDADEGRPGEYVGSSLIVIEPARSQSQQPQAPPVSSVSGTGAMSAAERNMVDKYRNCVISAAKGFARTRDSASNVAASALYSCQNARTSLSALLAQRFGFKYRQAIFKALEVRLLREAQVTVTRTRLVK